MSSRPSARIIAVRLFLVTVATLAVAAGLTGFSAALLARLGLFRSEAVLASNLISTLVVPTVLVWGFATRRPVLFTILTFGGSALMAFLSERI